LFVQDDFKLRPNLTLSLGLRYVATTGMSETHNALGGFDPDIVNPYCGTPSYLPVGTPAFCGTLGSMWFAGQDNRTTLQKPSYAIFLPRVGFAWSIRNDTVIRGGFGMYSYNYSQDTYGNGIGAGALTTSTGNTTDPNSGTGPSPLITLSASAATASSTLTYVTGSPSVRQPGTYCCTQNSPPNVTYVPYNVPVGRINQWQMSVEHQFGHSYMASIAYVGSHASNLQFPTDLNQITDPATLLGLASGSIPSQQLARPYPLWGSLGGNNYNDPAANYGNSNFNIPQAFKGYASYELPFGKGKPFLSGNSIVDSVVGGWRLAGTLISQSGVPFTITVNGANNSLSDCGNSCSWYPNRVGDPKSSIPAAPAGSISFFNPAAYAVPATGTFGNDGRNSISGPRLTVLNMGIAKSFSFGERVHLELRSDWVNALNHPSLGTPGNSLGGGNFGLINSGTENQGVSVAPRSGQLSAKITF
jgi:hypothetical protein